MRVLLAALVLAAACKRAPAPQAGPVVQEVKITEKGFEPARVEVPPSQEVTLRFLRKAAQTCADAVDVQGDPVRHMLPLDTPIEVKVKSPPSGELAFACPMKMYQGRIVVIGR